MAVVLLLSVHIAEIGLIGLPRTSRPKWGGVVTVNISAPQILSDPMGQHTPDPEPRP